MRLLVDHKNTFIVRLHVSRRNESAALYRAEAWAPAMSSPKILSVGYERELLGLRSLLLRQSLGVEMLEAFDLAVALRIARRKLCIDLVVLCHTVPATHQRMIVEAAHEQHADVQVLSILPGIFLAGTVGTPVSNDPEELLAAVRQALSVIRTLASTSVQEGCEISLDGSVFQKKHSGRLP